MLLYSIFIPWLYLVTIRTFSHVVGSSNIIVVSRNIVEGRLPVVGWHDDGRGGGPGRRIVTQPRPAAATSSPFPHLCVGGIRVGKHWVPRRRLLPIEAGTLVTDPR